MEKKVLKEKLNEVEIMKKLSSKSKLTAKDAQEISAKINENMARKFRGM